MLSGLTARIYRKNKWENVDIVSLTEPELKEYFGQESNSSRYLWILSLVQTIRKLLLENEELKQLIDLSKRTLGDDASLQLPEHILVNDDVISTKTQSKVLSFQNDDNGNPCVLIWGADIYTKGMTAKFLADMFNWHKRD